MKNGLAGIGVHDSREDSVSLSRDMDYHGRCIRVVRVHANIAHETFKLVLSGDLLGLIWTSFRRVLGHVLVEFWNSFRQLMARCFALLLRESMWNVLGFDLGFCVSCERLLSQLPIRMMLFRLLCRLLRALRWFRSAVTLSLTCNNYQYIVITQASSFAQQETGSEVCQYRTYLVLDLEGASVLCLCLCNSLGLLLARSHRRPRHLPSGPDQALPLLVDYTTAPDIFPDLRFRVL